MRVGQKVKIYGFLVWYARSFPVSTYPMGLPSVVTITRVSEGSIFFKDFNGKEVCIYCEYKYPEDILYFGSGPLLEIKK